jgi:hypothetical protein
MNRVILSCTCDKQHIYPLPFVVKNWNYFGFIPHAIIIDYKPSFYGQRAIKEAENFCNLIFLDSKEFNPAAVATFCRYYGSCFDFPEDDWCLFGDIDLFVMKMDWWSKRDNSLMHIYPSNVYDYYDYTKYCSCYVDAQKKTWQKILNLNDTFEKCLFRDMSLIRDRNFIHKRYKKTWKEMIDEGRAFDEEFLSEKIVAWEGHPNNCQMLPRKKKKEGTAYFKDRVDRSFWENLSDPVDVHFDSGDKNIFQKLKPYLEKFCDIDWAYKYHLNFHNHKIL